MARVGLGPVRKISDLVHKIIHGCPSSFSGVGVGVKFSNVLDIPSHPLHPCSEHGLVMVRDQVSLKAILKHHLSICSEVSPTC